MLLCHDVRVRARCMTATPPDEEPAGCSCRRVEHVIWSSSLADWMSSSSLELAALTISLGTLQTDHIQFCRVELRDDDGGGCFTLHSCRCSTMPRHMSHILTVQWKFRFKAGSQLITRSSRRRQQSRYQPLTAVCLIRAILQWYLYNCITPSGSGPVLSLRDVQQTSNSRSVVASRQGGPRSGPQQAA